MFNLINFLLVTGNVVDLIEIFDNRYAQIKFV